MLLIASFHFLLIPQNLHPALLFIHFQYLFYFGFIDLKIRGRQKFPCFYFHLCLLTLKSLKYLIIFKNCVFNFLNCFIIDNYHM